MNKVTLKVRLQDNQVFEKEHIELVGFTGLKLTLKQFTVDIYTEMHNDKFLMLEMEDKNLLIPRESISYIEVIPE